MKNTTKKYKVRKTDIPGFPISAKVNERIAINEDKNPIPRNTSQTCRSLKPAYTKWCVVWSFPPTIGDFPFLSRLITTVSVSTNAGVNAIKITAKLVTAFV